MEYKESLENIGLSEKETDIYMAALQLGKALPAVLARKAGIKHSTFYKIIPKLKEMGLISETIFGKRKFLIAEDPQVYLEAKRKELREFEKTIPSLRILLDTATVKPRIVFYDGVKGIKKLYMETLREKKPISEFVSLEKISPEIEFHSRNYYIPQRINRQIPIKIIVSGKSESELIKLKTESWALREVKIIDKERFPIPLDCYIFGDNVAFALYRVDSEPVGILIRSSEVATTLRSLFNFVWYGKTESAKMEELNKVNLQ